MLMHALFALLSTSTFLSGLFVIEHCVGAFLRTRSVPFSVNNVCSNEAFCACRAQLEGRILFAVNFLVLIGLGIQLKSVITILLVQSPLLVCLTRRGLYGTPMLLAIFINPSSKPLD